MAELKLNQFQVPVHLGCLEDERQKPQFVSFWITVRFPNLPQGAHSDQLEDTVCYTMFCDTIREITATKHFHLVEHLGHQVYLALRKQIDERIGLGVLTLKEKVPVENVLGGASFEIRDWEK